MKLLGWPRMDRDGFLQTKSSKSLLALRLIMNQIILLVCVLTKNVAGMWSRYHINVDLGSFLPLI